MSGFVSLCVTCFSLLIEWDSTRRLFGFQSDYDRYLQQNSKPGFLNHPGATTRLAGQLSFSLERSRLQDPTLPFKSSPERLYFQKIGCCRFGTDFAKNVVNSPINVKRIMKILQTSLPPQFVTYDTKTAVIQKNLRLILTSQTLVYIFNSTSNH